MAPDESDTPPPMPTVRALIADGAFEDALSALDAVVAHLERGGLSIDESVTWYELGLGLSRRCADLLQHAELRIAAIEERYASVPGARDPWDDDEDDTAAT